MQVIVIYSERPSVSKALGQAFQQFDNAKETRLAVMCCNSELEAAQTWAASLQKKFSDIVVQGFPTPIAVDDSATEELFWRFYPRCRNFAYQGETIVLHPHEVPAEDLWDVKMRDALRISNKDIQGHGERRVDGSDLLEGSFVYNYNFLVNSRGGRRYIPKQNIMTSVAWEVKQMGTLLDERPSCIQTVAEFREGQLSQPKPTPVVKEEVKEDPLAAMFAAKTEELKTETLEEEVAEVAPTPVAKKAAKKTAKKKATKRAKKKVAKKTAKKKTVAERNADRAAEVGVSPASGTVSTDGPTEGNDI